MTILRPDKPPRPGPRPPYSMTTTMSECKLSASDFLTMRGAERFGAVAKVVTAPALRSEAQGGS